MSAGRSDIRIRTLTSPKSRSLNSTELCNSVAGGRLTDDEYRQMTVPTWNRTLADFAAPFGPDGVATAGGLVLEDASLDEVPDPYLAEYRRSGDREALADTVTAFLRAFTEPSLFETLDRPAGERAGIAQYVYGTVRRNVAADPEAFETVWRSRESYLSNMAGFVEFHLLKGPVLEDHTLYSSHTTWVDKAAFEAWTKSEEFRRAHARADNKTGESLYLGHPKFEGFEVILSERKSSAAA